MHGYAALFSGKLSSVTTHSDNPAQGDEPVGHEPVGHELAAVSAPQPCEREAGGREVGGRQGPEPTRFGDWELRGRCIDF
jgi:hypothetical protein